MKNMLWLLTVAVVCVVAMAVQSQAQGPQPPPGVPDWAFPLATPNPPPGSEPPAGPRSIPGSTRTYTQEQIDDLFNPPDWFPEENRPVPEIVLKGRQPNAMACGSCHLMSGMGHPESSDLAGLPVTYMIRQMEEFKSGVRRDYARMNGIASATTEEEWRQAAEWFSRLKPIPWTRVVEAETVPRTFLTGGRMRLPIPGGGTEPIGSRIITLPEDVARATARDPKSGFIAYVPPGSIAKGRELATTGGNGKTIPCNICHGPDLRGMGDVPRLAGMHPIYAVCQMYHFKIGWSNGTAAQLMKPAVAQLTDEDILILAAYVASLPVE